MFDDKQYFDSNIATHLLFINAILLLIGRSWQHFADSVPVRALLWNEELFRPLVEAVNVSWVDYVTNLQYDQSITYFTYLFGSFYALLAALLIVTRGSRMAKYKRYFLGIIRRSLEWCSLFLFILAFCYFLDKNYLLGQWGEYALQWMSPLFLSIYLFRTQTTRWLVIAMKIALAVTFVCHGLYALGYYPVPGSFQTMLMRIFPLTAAQTQQVLKVAGIADLILSIVIFLPQRKWVLIALGYATVWGFLTALARPVAHFYPQFWWDSLTQWIPEFLFRAPHFLIPAWLYLHHYYTHPHVQDLQNPKN